MDGGSSMAHRGLSPMLLSVALAAACSSPMAPIDAEPPSPAQISAEPALERPQVPRAGERLEYAIALAGLPVGSATFTTRLQGEWLRLEVEGGTNALVDLLYSVRGLARARLDESGRSKSFFLWMEENGRQSERALAFRDLPCLYYRPWNDEPWVASLTQYREPRDPLSLLLEVRRLEPSTGARDFEVAMTLRSFCYRVRYLGREDVKVGAGEFGDALLFRIEVRPYRELSEAPDVGPIVGFYDVVVSADERRLPLRVAREFGFGQVVLELEETGTVAAEEEEEEEEEGEGVALADGAPR